MEPRFSCTACGACCHGWLPLTLADAVAHAGRFPLAMVWTPVRPNARSYDLATRLGATLRLPNRKTVAVLIVPTAYLPPSHPCPELRDDGRCAIHGTKPSRCRTMPFYPYREERDQADLLIPRKGWACDVSAAAPAVYRNHTILDRTDFDRERAELLDQAPVIRRYADYMVKYMPWILGELAKLPPGPAGGSLVTSLSSFLTATRRPDAAQIAAAQAPLFQAMAGRTRDDPALRDYHRNYAGWAREMEALARRASAQPTPPPAQDAT
ncbi:YkgJ family cysteine cluster protein [Azospirillum thermophilum]|uniref:Zinc/iron-chelating domain-containing protein n=1 Tax=Azospirillum thermophilum TaxID=2202148 RepID=A0A2S2CSN2_9PROT|nr:YkgJ family cysteine cluster protein [Azospirillum thermophilum]AWK87390.1 zinc/iron-chelating domain-containing protein [Azospirillum thermophilum]